MPNTASASVLPRMWAMPQSSRVSVTARACACQRARRDAAAAEVAGGAAVAANASVRPIRIRACLEIDTIEHLSLAARGAYFTAGGACRGDRFFRRHENGGEER